jgi:hypothetical protein
MLRRLITTGLGLLAGILVAAGPAAAQTLDKIKQRGVLVVGSKADYKPFGFRDPAGNIVGFEPDLARDVADRLSARLELEPVVSSNRMQFLQQGKSHSSTAEMHNWLHSRFAMAFPRSSSRGNLPRRSGKLWRKCHGVAPSNRSLCRPNP